MAKKKQDNNQTSSSLLSSSSNLSSTASKCFNQNTNYQDVKKNKLTGQRPSNQMIRSIVWLTFFISIVSILIGLYINQQSTDHDKSCPTYYQTNQYRLYGKSTVYSAGKEAFIKQFGDNNQIINHGCTPKMFYFVGRHSIRYPSRKKINLMSKLLPTIQEEIIKSSQSEINNSQLYPGQLEAIKNWQLRWNPDDGNRISETGFNETQQLAQKLYKKFPGLLDASKSEINIGTTYETRTKETAQAFLDGLNQIQPRFQVPIEDKAAVYFHRTCKKILGDRLKDSGKREQMAQSQLAQELIGSISRRLGIDRKFSFEEILLLHVACAFEFAIFGESPWCYVFSEKDLHTLEFFHDVDEYFTDGHGLELNQQMACPLITDLILTIKESITSTKPKSTLLFSHAGALQRLWTYLGLFDKLSTDDNLTFDSERHWRTSKIIPFNGNFIVILYDCGEKGHMILPLIQEVPVQIQGCPDHLCPLDEFLTEYETRISECDLNELCKPQLRS